MRFIVLVSLALTISLLALAFVVLRKEQMHLADGPRKKQVVLIGASIGAAWRLADWPTRVHTSEFSTEFLAAWQFDKSGVVEEVLMRPHMKVQLNRTFLRALFVPPKKPDIVILKECSSYFPGNLNVYRDSIQTWVRWLHSHNIRVMLATVVPVTRARSDREPGKQEGLLEYNRWVRDYARMQGLPVLDLEAATRIPADETYLRDDFAANDGSHLNARAYAMLDQVLLTALCGTGPACTSGPVAEGLVSER